VGDAIQQVHLRLKFKWIQQETKHNKNYIDLLIDMTYLQVYFQDKITYYY